MRPWIIVSLGLCLLVAGASFWEFRRLRDRCNRDDVNRLLVDHVNGGKPGDGLLISGGHLGAGQFFRFPYECEADVTLLTGNVDLSTKPRQHLRFLVSHAGETTSLEFINQPEPP